MKLLLAIAAVIAMPYFTDWLVDRQFRKLEINYTPKQVSELHTLQDRELSQKDIGVLFVPKNEHERAEVLADIWGLK